MARTEETQTVLVVAAHPDDELLGAGATFAKRLRHGDQVHAIVVCEGESVRYDGYDVKQQDDAQRAANIIGFTSFKCLMMADQKLDTLPQLEVNQKIEAVIDELRPSVVYTHYYGDLNEDHQVVHSAVMVATRPARTFIHEVLGFETPSSTGMWTGHAFDPDTYEIVSEDDLEKKLNAMACYETEALPYPHPRSPAALRHRAHFWGNNVNQDAAEAFVTLRRIRHD